MGTRSTVAGCDRTHATGKALPMERFTLKSSATTHEPDLITVSELAARLGIGRTKLYELLNTGQLPIRRIRLGEHWRFSRVEVERFCHGGLSDDDINGAAA